MPRSSKTLILLVLFVLILGNSASAETTNVSGADGVDGFAGGPGAAGAPGTDGANATALADAPGEGNFGTASAGAGGDGGAGGAAATNGGDGGAGGDAGHGGNAGATAMTAGAVAASAEAVAGAGGAPGAGGAGSPPGVDGAPGLVGNGGDAMASATNESTLTSFVSANSIATGGATAPVSGSHVGGSATATSSSTNNGTGTAIAEATARGGGALQSAGAQRGGDAVASSTAVQGNGGRAIARSTAVGGVGAEGGDANASAFAMNSGAGDVEAVATALYGQGTVGAGDAVVFAEGRSSGGGNVDVSALLRKSAFGDVDRDVELHDAVSGSTAGRLSLSQVLSFSTEDFPFSSGFGRDAVTTLAASNPGGGDLDVSVLAAAGLGVISTVPGGVMRPSGGDVVLGDITAEVTTAANVTVDVSVFGGGGARTATSAQGDAGDGGTVKFENRGVGPATKSRVYGRSDGGIVSVTGSFRAGDGGDAGASSTMAAGDGADLDATNIVDGDTTGALSLRQDVLSGSGGVSIPNTTGGDAGAATSVLEKETTSSSLDMSAGAFAGAAELSGRSAGKARSEARGTNHGGAANVIARSSGGGASGVSPFDPAPFAGDATSIGEARTTMAGAAAEAFASATGGNVAGRGIEDALAPGRSGDGHATAGAIADADASAIATASARGGRVTTVPLNDPAGQRGVDGGSALADASATGAGVSTVEATATATGADGASRFGIAGNGGDADASAFAMGAGHAIARSTATAGDSVPDDGDHLRRGGGAALAQASARGAMADVRAEATSGRGFQHQLFASLAVAVGPANDVAARLGSGLALADLPATPGLEAASLMTTAPGAADVGAARAGNTGLDALLASSPQARAISLGRWSSAGRGDGGDAVVVTTELSLLMEESGPLVFGVFGVASSGDELVELVLRVGTDEAAAVETTTFTSVDDFVAFFSEETFALGAAIGDVRIELDATVASNASFGFDFAWVLVPEPSTGLLVFLGIAVLGRRRAR